MNGWVTGQVSRVAEGRQTGRSGGLEAKSRGPGGVGGRATGPASFPQTQGLGSDSFEDAALGSRWRLPLGETEQVCGAGGLGRVYQLRDAYSPVRSALAASSCCAMPCCYHLQLCPPQEATCRT